MIPTSAIKRYLKRPLDNHLWLKTAPTRNIVAALETMEPPPELNPELRHHQLGCFLLGVAYPQFAFWLDMGVGKTLIALELLKYWHRCGQLRRAFVFITSDKAFPTWEKQVARFNIKLPYILLEGSSERKWAALEEFDEGLIFVSYPGAVAMVSRSTLRRGKARWRLDPKLTKRFSQNVDAFVMDESTMASGYTSLTHELMDKLGKTAQIRYALAGRPFGRDPTLLWAQHYLVDKGETLGPTLGLFRAAFFKAVKNPWGSKYSFDYKFNKAMEPQLSRMIQHRSIAYAANECIDLPEHSVIVEEVAFAEEAENYYRRAVKAIIEAKSNMRVVKSLFLRMRQISSGFLGFKDDETGDKAQVEFGENPKLERLLELLEELPQDSKAVVFYDFTWSGRKVDAAATDLRLKPIWLWSGTKDYRRDLTRFEKDPACRVAVVQSRVGAFSLDGLQVANYCFFYESPVSVIAREQAERRLRRQGQLKKVMQYDIIVKGSMDAKILAFHKQGEDLLKALLRNPSLAKG